MGVPWSLDEDAVLFAWLNFCIGLELSYKKTILGKLAELGTERSWSGVRKRLQDLVVKSCAIDETGRPLFAGGHEDDAKTAVILERGSDCLQSTSHEFRQKVKLALQKYRRENQENSKGLQSNKQSNSQPLPQKRVSNVPVSSSALQTGSEVVHASEESNPEEETTQRKRRRLDQVWQQIVSKFSPRSLANCLGCGQRRHQEESAAGESDS
jgi:hypothetical protein